MFAPFIMKLLVYVFLWVLPCRHPFSVPKTRLLIILQRLFLFAEARSARSKIHTLHLLKYCFNVCISRLFVKTHPNGTHNVALFLFLHRYRQFKFTNYTVIVLFYILLLYFVGTHATLFY